MKIALGGPDKQAVKPLARVIDRTADATGLDDVTVLRVASYLWQFLADEVTKGEVVTIPSFGAFGAWWDERWRTRPPGKLPVVKPVFSPCQAFTAQVNLGAPRKRVAKKRLKSHRGNHSFCPETRYTHKRVWSTMEEIRKQIDAQMGGG